jgi:hypothetical protein
MSCDAAIYTSEKTGTNPLSARMLQSRAGIVKKASLSQEMACTRNGCRCALAAHVCDFIAARRCAAAA